jgi:hypothetical protein
MNPSLQREGVVGASIPTMLCLGPRERANLDGPSRAGGRDPGSEFENGVVIVARE